MSTSNPGLTRAPSEPGPGGFPGGVGGYLNEAPQPGGGYVGGAAGYSSGGSGSYGYYNSQLTPLIGGPGGGGGGVPGQGLAAGGNGGAGGGAMRIVSSTSISVTGSISAQGGVGSQAVGNQYQPNPGGYGSGGVIHLIAPTVTGNGALYICGGGNNGIIQFNASTNSFSGTLNGCGAPPFYNYGLYNPPLPTGTPSVRVVSVDGVAAPSQPTASFSVPDVTINASGTVTVDIAAANIPLGTVVSLYISSQSAPDATATCAPLSGTLASSTAQCTSVNFPSGVGITQIKANW
jgi:hypothetical protein